MLMQEFPPPPNDRVTLANWQDQPFNQWSFSHMRELVPTQIISRGTTASAPLPTSLQEVGKVRVHDSSGTETDVDSVLDSTYTDAVVIVHDGKVVLERYLGESRPGRPHLLMSMTKSVIGCVAANLIESGAFSPEDFVTAHIPELAGSGYDGATVRNLLDMRSGVKFSEDYTNPDAEVRVMEEAFGWRPTSDRDVSRSIYDYLPTLTTDGEHGGPFRYRSCETLVLGWVCERAGRKRMAAQISELIWVPMGAGYDADITCDSVGTAIHDGGMSATARDLARFGLMLLHSGEAEGNRVVPAKWLRASWAVDPDIRDAFDHSESGPYLPGGWYRNQFWFLPREHGDVMLCLGINGQMLYINPGTKTVAVKLSSWPDAQAPMLLHDTFRAFDAVGANLSGLTPDRATHQGPPGIAAGLSR